MIFYAIITAAIIAADQLVKAWAKTSLMETGTIPVIRDVFHLTYAENRGAAFSMLEGQRWFFIILTSVMLVVIAMAFFKEFFKGVWGKTTLVFIFAGAVGNFIDRVWLGFVVDMFDFRLIDFPIFNVADIFLTVGAVMGIIYILFIDKDLFKEEKKVKNDDSENNG
jgi:signal peptidase II